MKKIISIGGVVVLLLVLCFFFGKTIVQKNNVTKKTNVITALFECKDKKTIQSIFFDSNVELTLNDGRTMLLKQAVSASGARYTNSDETFVFWNKGDTAFIEEKNKENRLEKSRKSLIEKYGVDSIFKIPEYQEKIKDSKQFSNHSWEIQSYQRTKAE
jgi:membrane-bound inhibitor of C-type lysozyme